MKTVEIKKKATVINEVKNGKLSWQELMKKNNEVFQRPTNIRGGTREHSIYNASIFPTLNEVGSEKELKKIQRKIRTNVRKDTLFVAEAFNRKASVNWKAFSSLVDSVYIPTATTWYEGSEEDTRILFDNLKKYFEANRTALLAQ
jgi:hypothetical protein